jgi:pilus assembly protein CpaC
MIGAGAATAAEGPKKPRPRPAAVAAPVDDLPPLPAARPLAFRQGPQGPAPRVFPPPDVPIPDPGRVAPGRAPQDLPPPLPVPAGGPPLPGEPIDPFIGPLTEVTFKGEIPLILKREKVLRIRHEYPIRQVFLGDFNVADVTVINAENAAENPNRARLLKMYGKSFGTTTLTLIDDQDRPTAYLIRVMLDTADISRRIGQSFPGAEVHVRQVGMQLIMEGQVPDTKTMADVLQLVQAEMRVSGQAAVGSLAGSLGFGGAGGVGAGATAPTIIAGGGGAGTGGFAGGGGLGSSGALGGLATPGVAQPGLTIINRVHVPGPRQVLLKVKIAELDRAAVRQFGINFTRVTNGNVYVNAIGGLGTAIGGINPGASTLFGVFDTGKFSLFINALRQNNIAKVLAEPNLLTLDGQPARFLAGGQFPYPVPQSSSIPGGTAVVTIQFKDFGAILEFVPHILANDVIRLDVEPVFSELNFASGTTVNGGPVPAINQRSARTVVELREGQTLAIGGLLQTTTNGQTTRIPILGDLPIVGPIFSNNSYNVTETELVVLVEPVLVQPMEAKATPPAPGDLVLEPNDWEFYFLGRLEGRTGHPHRSTLNYLDPLEIMKHVHSDKHWLVGPHGYAD